MPFFFDSHFHATLKKQFANPAGNFPGGLSPTNPWHTATTKDFLAGFKALSLVKCLLRPFVESSLISQSSLSQLSDSGYKLAVMVLFAPDKGLIKLIVDNRQFFNIVKNGKFGDFLTKDRFESLRDENNAFKILTHDLELLDMHADGRSVVKLANDQFNPGPGDPLALVFSVEGLHSLRSDLGETDTGKIISDILTNLDSITTSNRVITVNIAHIDSANAIFANQAYAMDGFREAGFVETNLRPAGLGLTDAGRTIAAELYKREVLPDLKHMSWLSRRQFYQFRKDNGITAPLVCSHTGFTGCWFNSQLFNESITDFIVQVREEQHVNSEPRYRIVLSKPDPYLQSKGIGFNASSINLFNEDIRAILESDGLIGISMDQRILGYSDFQDDGSVLSNNVIDIDGLKVVTDSDYISAKEFKLLQEYSRPAPNIEKIARGVNTDDRKTGNTTDVRNFFHPRHFYLQIAHAIKVARMVGELNGGSGEEAAVQMLSRTLCIGSDFDGLIDGLDCSPNATQIQNLKEKFISEFERFLKEVNVQMPAGLTVPFVADRIFYENGRDFVLRRLTILNKRDPAALAMKR